MEEYLLNGGGPKFKVHDLYGKCFNMVRRGIKRSLGFRINFEVNSLQQDIYLKSGIFELNIR